MVEAVEKEVASETQERGTDESGAGESVSETPEGVSVRILGESQSILEESSLVALVDTLVCQPVFFEVPFVLSAHRSESGLESLVGIWNIVVDVVLPVISMSKQTARLPRGSTSLPENSYLLTSAAVSGLLFLMKMESL